MAGFSTTESCVRSTWLPAFGIIAGNYSGYQFDESGKVEGL